MPLVRWENGQTVAERLRPGGLLFRVARIPFLVWLILLVPTVPARSDHRHSGGGTVIMLRWMPMQCSDLAGQWR